MKKIFFKIVLITILFNHTGLAQKNYPFGGKGFSKIELDSWIGEKVIIKELIDTTETYYPLVTIANINDNWNFDYNAVKSNIGGQEFSIINFLDKSSFNLLQLSNGSDTIYFMWDKSYRNNNKDPKRVYIPFFSKSFMTSLKKTFENKKIWNKEYLEIKDINGIKIEISKLSPSKFKRIVLKGNPTPYSSPKFKDLIAVFETPNNNEFFVDIYSQWQTSDYYVPSGVKLENFYSAEEYKRYLDTKTFSIKGYTIGDKPQKNSFDDYNTLYRKISLGNLDMDLTINLNNDIIYKLYATGKCNKIEEAKKFRLLVQSYYDIEFKLLPVKTNSYYRTIIDKRTYKQIRVKDISKKYTRIAYKNNIKYILTTTNLKSQSSIINISLWNIEFTILDTSIEKEIKNEKSNKRKQIEEINKNNF